jgi:hypothetical protein
MTDLKNYLTTPVPCACGAVTALPAEPVYCQQCKSFTHSSNVKA